MYNRKEYDRAYYLKHRARILQRQKEYNKIYFINDKEYHNKYYNDNKPRILEYQRAYQKKYYQKHRLELMEKRKITARLRYLEVKENGRLNTFG